MASLNHLLFWVNYIIVVGAAVSALLYLFPAYRRRQNRAFLYLAFAFLLFIFDAVADHTFALWHIPWEQQFAYFVLRRLTAAATVILLAVGVIGLTRSLSPPREDDEGKSEV
jgi:uncharacterized membrane protein YfhO